MSKHSQRPTGLSAMAQRIDRPAISWLMDLALQNPKLISLAAGFTDNPSLPVLETQQALKQVLGSARSARPALQYGATAGDAALRQSTVERLAELDGREAKVSAEQTLLTHGSQQLLYILTEVLCDEGDIILVEDPTYFVFLGILQSRGIRCRGVAMENDGVCLKSLKKVLEELRKRGELKRLKCFYGVTYFQNPSGITSSAAKKSGTLDLLRHYEKLAGHPLYYLEDAAYRELRFSGEDVPSALVLDRKAPERVLYAGTYSKPFATGVRVGFGLLPEPVFTAALRIKGNHDFGTSNLLQKVVAQAMRSGRYQRHVVELQERYRKKAAIMTEAIEKYFPREVQWEQPKGGLYVWATLPSSVRTGPDSTLFKTALKNGVLYVPGSLCFGADPTRGTPDHSMRISFGGAEDKVISSGIQRLARSIDQSAAEN